MLWAARMAGSVMLRRGMNARLKVGNGPGAQIGPSPSQGAIADRDLVESHPQHLAKAASRRADVQRRISFAAIAAAGF